MGKKKPPHTLVIACSRYIGRGARYEMSSLSSNARQALMNLDVLALVQAEKIASARNSKTGRKNRTPEHYLEERMHSLCFEVAFEMEEENHFVYTHHSPNGASVSGGARGVLSGMGMRKGWPDLQHCLAGGRHFLVEMKAPSGTVSPEQKKIITRLNKTGTPAYVAWSCVEWGMIVQAELAGYRLEAFRDPNRDGRRAKK